MRVAITGGAGYVGSALVPFLLKKEFKATVLDTFWYGDHLNEHHNLIKIKGDIRDPQALARAFKGADVVLHLACVSNDPSFELNAHFGKSINYDSFDGILVAVENAKAHFVYASSSSVYGIKEGDVTEKSPCLPLTGYSRYKYLCEMKLMTSGCGQGAWTILRPATVCGFAPRLRLDLVVNAMTANALFKRKIPVTGGAQLRPNINIKDMVQAYYRILLDIVGKQSSAERTYNVGYENMSLLEIATLVKNTVQMAEDYEVELEVVPTDDNRSYHVNSDLIKKELGFEATHTIQHAVASIVSARALHLINGASDPVYYNIQTMKGLLGEGTVQLS